MKLRTGATRIEIRIFCSTPGGPKREVRVPDSAESFFLGGEEAEKAFDVGYLERIPNALAHTDQGERVSFFIVTNMGSDECSNAGRVDIRNGGEINHECARILGTNRILKLE